MRKAERRRQEVVPERSLGQVTAQPLSVRPPEDDVEEKDCPHGGVARVNHSQLGRVLVARRQVEREVMR